MKKIPEIQLGTHRFHHWDEALGACLEIISELQKRGKEKDVKSFLETLKKAKFCFFNAGEEFNIFPFPVLGTGKGKNDEHINGSLDTDRLPQECCATRTQKKLERENEDFAKITERLGYLIEYSLLVDSTGQKKGPCELATASSEMTEMLGDEESIRIGIGIAYAFYKTERMEKIKRKALGKALAFYIAGWLKTNKIDNFAGLPLAKFAKGLINGNKYDFDYNEIFFSLKRAYGRQEAFKIFDTILQAKHYMQKFLEKAFEEIEEKGKFFPTKKGLLLDISSDNPMISKAARLRKTNKRPEVAMVRIKNISGNDIIMANKIFAMEKIMDNLAAALRFEEQFLRKEFKSCDYNENRKAGDLIRVWYYQREQGGGKLMNGAKSKTLTEEEKTIIPDGRTIDLIKKVVDLGENFKWPVWLFKEYGIKA